MPLNLSIKNVPDEVAERLRQRAARAHRSLQGELIAILEEAVASSPRLTPQEVLAAVDQLGLRTKSEAGGWVREDRDRR